MELIDQHTKQIMEDSKARARKAGLMFDDETLEYIVTNRDMLELSPKLMIPTLYDYWVNDVEVLKGIGKYKLYPHNPYETVINSRPAISFYNDNNPDWLNVMIFYHVLGHIDFFQNNVMFEHTWSDDFVGQALADKRLVAEFRKTHGRWVDYAIEFSRNIDNLSGYFRLLSKNNIPEGFFPGKKLEYYFSEFLPNVIKAPDHSLFKEIERYNGLVERNKMLADSEFFADVRVKYPEFQAKYEKFAEKKSPQPIDIMQYIMDNSPFLRKEENQWMKQIMSVVRNTSLYFAPQIRTKIVNEGWASYWHDELFRIDDRIKGHEVNYAVVNAAVTSVSHVGLNPYAIGLRLMHYIEDLADKGKISYYFQKIFDLEARNRYDKKTGKGKEALFEIRKKFNDFSLINTFVDQDFVNKYNLYVVGRRLNQQRMTWEYYVKSRKAADYKKMLIDSLYHPPTIIIDASKTTEEVLYLKHTFEGKQLIKDFIPDTLLGIHYLWGGRVDLETTEIVVSQRAGEKKPSMEYRPVRYTIKDRKTEKKNL